MGPIKPYKCKNNINTYPYYLYIYNMYNIYIYIYIYIYQAIKSDGKKEQILSIFYVTKAFLLTNLQSVTKIIFLQKKFLCYMI